MFDFEIARLKYESEVCLVGCFMDRICHYGSVYYRCEGVPNSVADEAWDNAYL